MGEKNKNIIECQFSTLVCTGQACLIVQALSTNAICREEPTAEDDEPLRRNWDVRMDHEPSTMSSKPLKNKNQKNFSQHLEFCHLKKKKSQVKYLLL